MLLQFARRSVGRRTCLSNGPVALHQMFQTIDDLARIPHSAVTTTATVGRKRFMATMEKPTIPKGRTEEDEEYEKAIKALNTLQSNADTLRLAMALDSKQTALEDTVKYLHRSGLSFEQLDHLSVIHVSGTKGKGSTCALTESILRSNGVTTGFFSSPHLVSVTERIRINGQPIPKHKFTQAFWRIFKRLERAREHPKDMPPYFKFLTILSFHIFLEEKVDVTVLEVGIGGDLDCTNVVRHTKTVGITSLGLEHTQLLGNTLEEIAWHKAGIIKENSRVYTSVTQPECLRVIGERAKEKNATVHRVPELLQYALDADVVQQLNNVTLLNGSLAIHLANDWLRTNRPSIGDASFVTPTQLSATTIDGLIRCSWPGRCQIVNFGNFKIHLDGAHTVESMCVCRDWFHRVSASSGNPKILLFNTTGDRDSRKLLQILRRTSPFTMACFLPNIAWGRANMRPDNMTVFGISEQLNRAKMHAANWHQLCQEAGEADNSRLFGSILDSFNELRKRFGSEQEIDVLVTGSLHLIGASVLALDEFRQRLEQS